MRKGEVKKTFFRREKSTEIHDIKTKAAMKKKITLPALPQPFLVVFLPCLAECYAKKGIFFSSSGKKLV